NQVLSRFFTTGELDDQQLFEIDHGKEKAPKACRWQFKDLSLGQNNRICLAVGKLPESPVTAKQKPILGQAFRINPDEIDRYRFLAANIPLTNIFLINSDLIYVLAEGPNFEYWGLERSHFEGRNLKEVHTT